jgi:hypothetical protein
MLPRPTEVVRNLSPDRKWIWAGIGGLTAALVIGWLALSAGEWATALEHWMLGRGVWAVAIFAGIFVAATLVLRQTGRWRSPPGCYTASGRSR